MKYSLQSFRLGFFYAFITMSVVFYLPKTLIAHSNNIPSITKLFLEDPFDEFIKKGLTALENENAIAAMDWFDKARKSTKEKNQKKMARGLKRQAKIYKAFFNLLQQGEKFSREKNWKSAQDKFEGAKKKLTSVDFSLSEQFSKFYHKSNAEIKERISVENLIRKKAIDEAMVGAEAILDLDPNGAFSKLKYAESQMNNQEKAAASIYSKIQVAQDRVDYMDNLTKGNDARSRGNYLKALDWYEKAIAKWNTPEVTNLILETRINIHDQFRMEGENAFNGANFELALEKFKKAQEYQNTPAIRTQIQETIYQLNQKHLREGDNFVARNDFDNAFVAYEKAKSYLATSEVEDRIIRAKDKKYEYHVHEGRTAYNNKNYSGAQQQYQQAQSVRNSNEIQKLMALADNGINYENYMNWGSNQERNGNIAAAKSSFINAQAHMNTEEVRQKLQNIAAYEANMQNGKNAFYAKEKSMAMNYFKNASFKYNTPEARDWITKTEKMPTDVIITIDQRILDGYVLESVSISIYKKANNQKTFIKSLAFARGRYNYQFYELQRGNYIAEIYGQRPKDKSTKTTSNGISSITMGLTSTITKEFWANGGKLTVYIDK